MKKDPKPLKIEDTVKVFREIGKFIDSNPDMMNVEGVFRISANAKKPPEIIKTILRKRDIAKKDYSIHDLIGSLKESLKNNILLKYESSHITQLRKVMNEVDTSDTKSVAKAVNAVNQLIQQLANSKEKQDKQIAEILHTYIHIASVAARYADTNKMTPNNLSIAAIGPLFYNNIMIANNPMETLALISKAGPIAAEVIAFSFYDAAYQPPATARAKPVLAYQPSTKNLRAQEVSSKENVAEKNVKKDNHLKR